jgi:hypothetical protein
MAAPDVSKRSALSATRDRLTGWIKRLHHDPTAEERAASEHREQLLRDLATAVADAPDDVPIKNVIERLNRHRDD